MPRLGIDRIFYVTEAHERDRDGNPVDPDNAAWISYRDPTTEEVTLFNGSLAQAQAANEGLGAALSDLCFAWGQKIVVDAGGFEVPDGVSQLEALSRWGFHHVAEIGQRAFMLASGQKLSLGKSNGSLGRSTAASSATSPETPAST